MTALIVVDMLNEFVYGKLGSPEAQAIIPPIEKLLSWYREKDLPIAWVSDAHTLDYARFGNYPDRLELEHWGVHAEMNTPAAQIVVGLQPVDSRRMMGMEQEFLKQKYGGFSTHLSPIFSLAPWLNDRGIHEVVLVGTATHICVQHTAYEAFTLGFETAVVADATVAFETDTSRNKEYALKYMAEIYGTRITTVKEIVGD